jgi:hypothetical protein
MNGYRYFLAVVFCTCANISIAQTNIKGTVKDKSTGAPLSFVSVSFPGTDIGGLTDDNGRFSLETNQKVDQVRIFLVGYKEVLEKVVPGSSATINVLLEEQQNTLQEISISSKKAVRYRNKENPAVELIRKVIERKDQNYDQGKANATYNEYEKLQISLLRSTDKIRNSDNKSILSSLFKKADTSKVEGKAALPVVLHEKAIRYSNNKEQLLDEKRTSLDGIVDDGGLEAYLEKIYASTNIYDNNIKLGDQQLLSPLAGLAPEFYKYYITDTQIAGGMKMINVSFYPRNKAALLFKGNMLVDPESYAVSEAYMTVGKGISLNWVNDLKITLTYNKSDNNTYYLQYSLLAMTMSVLGKNGGFYGEKIKSVKDYYHNAVPDKQNSTGTITSITKPVFTESDWGNFRPQALNTTEQNAYANIDTLKNTPSFKRVANILTLLLSGYQVLGPVEIGPVSSFYSYNPVEGPRVKLGGRTSNSFSKRWVLEGHAAYGFRDKRWKYNGGITYSLNDHSIFDFPVRTISLHHSYETQIPGQDLTFAEEDNALLSFKRGSNDKWLYNDKWNIDYVHEMQNHISFKVGFMHSVQSPAGHLLFQSGSEMTAVNKENITVSELSGEIRWAPHEQFYQGKKFRRPVYNSYPVFTLRGTVGIKGLMNAEYNYQSIAFNVFKRFYLSQLGFTDVILEGGKLFGTVPFPLLYIHKANQTYSYQLYAYNLMNFMEFVSDRYISLNIDHSFNGFFLNKIPLVKKLKLREVATFKALYGDIGNNNMPVGAQDQLFNFPVDKQRRTLSHSLRNSPYIEGSIGISNIFKILRVDVIKRFTYLNHPGITTWGIRARMVLAL